MKRVDNAHIPVVALTHEGMKGKNNEDSYAVSAYRLEDKNSSPVLLAILSDGIGGHRAGEVASRLAVDTISQHIAKSDGSQPVQSIKDAIDLASGEIFAKAQENAERHGMGATCSCVNIIGNRLYMATVGDSRVYMMRNGKIQQLSTDHTWIQEALDSGLITPDQVAGHPNAHVIRRYLGGPKSPVVDVRIKLTGSENGEQAEANQGTLIQPGDFFLLCSDGLTDLVKDDEIFSTVTQQPIEKAIQALIDLANQRGGHDNITIIIIQVPQTVKMQGVGFPWMHLGLSCLGLAILAGVAIAMGWGWMWYSSGNKLEIIHFLFPESATTTSTPSSVPTTPSPTFIIPTLKPTLTPPGVTLSPSAQTTTAISGTPQTSQTVQLTKPTQNLTTTQTPPKSSGQPPPQPTSKTITTSQVITTFEPTPKTTTSIEPTNQLTLQPTTNPSSQPTSPSFFKTPQKTHSPYQTKEAATPVIPTPKPIPTYPQPHPTSSWPF